jgi:hypothetical protein
MTRAQDTTAATGPSGTIPFFDIGQERTEAMVALQRELSEICEEFTRAWLARVDSEIILWSEPVARSVPDVLAVCAKSASQRIQMTVDDGRRLTNDFDRVASGDVRLNSTLSWEARRER